ncbi:transcriptional regulator domain-containing protein [Sphingomonas sp. RB1R13]|uniref:transcriptional regulator domain-containing protein n=1 Tax=Sphingomonas sp. RB1R13 TaxID=3096159 RepID=UPI003FA6AE33
MSSDLRVSVAHSASLTSSYGHLRELDRAGWAWEWLRRNPDFTFPALTTIARTATSSVIVIHSETAMECSLLRWGLHYG